MNRELARAARDAGIAMGGKSGSGADAGVQLQRQRSAALIAEYNNQARSVENLQRQRSTAMIAQENANNRAVDTLQRQRSTALLREENQRNQASASLQRQRSAAMVAQFRKEEAETKAFSDRINQITQGITLAAGAGITYLGTISVQNAIQMDSLVRGLTAIAGSSQEAESQLKRLREIAKLPGIGFREAIEGSIRLQAVGFSAAEAEKALRAFSKAVAFTGGGRVELDKITVQLAQMSAKSKILAQDLKPIIEAAPAVGQALKELFGTVDSEQLSKILESKGISTKEFLNQLETKLLTLPVATDTAANALDNLSDQFFITTAAIGQKFVPALVLASNILGPVMELLGRNAGVVILVATALGVLSVAILLSTTRFAMLTGAQIASAVAGSGVVRFFTLLITVMGDFNLIAALTAGEMVVLTGGLAAIGIVIAAVYLAFRNLNQEEQKHTDISQTTINALVQQRNVIGDQLLGLSNLNQETTSATDKQQLLTNIYSSLNAESKTRVDVMAIEVDKARALAVELERLNRLRQDELAIIARTTTAELVGKVNEIAAKQTQLAALTTRVAALQELQRKLDQGLVPADATAPGGLLSGSEIKYAALGDKLKYVASESANAQNHVAELRAETDKLTQETVPLAQKQAGLAQILGTTSDGLVTQTFNYNLLKGSQDTALQSLQQFNREQQIGQSAVNATTNAIQSQIAALDKLSDAERAGARRKLIGDSMAQIAEKSGGDPARAKQLLNEAMTKGLGAVVKQEQDVKKVMKVLDGIIDPQKPAGGGGGGRTKPVDEVKSIGREVEKLQQQVTALRAGGGRLFDLQMQRDELSETKNQLTEILKLRRQLSGTSADQASREAELRDLNRMKSARDEVVKASEAQRDANVKLWTAEHLLGLPVVDALTRATTSYLESLRKQRDEEQQVTADLANEYRRRDQVIRDSLDFRIKAEAQTLQKQVSDRTNAIEAFQRSVAAGEAALGNQFSNNPIVQAAGSIASTSPQSPVLTRLDTGNKLLEQIAVNTGGKPGSAAPVTGANTKGFDPRFAGGLADLFGQMRGAGLHPTVYSGVRTADQQRAAWAKGRPTRYTGAPGSESPHQLGLAADIVGRPGERSRIIAMIAQYVKEHPEFNQAGFIKNRFGKLMDDRSHFGLDRAAAGGVMPNSGGGVPVASSMMDTRIFRLMFPGPNRSRVDANVQRAGGGVSDSVLRALTGKGIDKASIEELNAATAMNNRMGGGEVNTAQAELTVARHSLMFLREQAAALTDIALKRKVEIDNVIALDAAEHKLNALRRGDGVAVQEAIQDATIARQNSEASTLAQLIAMRAEDVANFVQSEEFKSAAMDKAEFARRTNMRSLAEQSIALDDQLAHSGEDAALRYEIAWKKAHLSIKEADIAANESIIAGQVELADKSVYHAARANDMILKFLNQQKSVTEMIADFKIGLMQKGFDGIDTVLGKLIPKLGGFGDLIRQLIASFLKLQATKLFARLLGLDGGGSSEGGSGGGGGKGGGILGWLGSLLRPGGGGGAIPLGGGGGIMNVLGGGSGGAIPLGGGGGGGILGMLGQGGGGIGGGLLGGFFGGGAAAASAATAGLSATSIGAGAVNTVSGGLPALTTGGAGGAGLMGSMGALFTNPWTAVVAGGIVASLLLYRHFAHRTEKKLRETIQSTYGVAVKDMAVLKQVKEVGEQRFGKGQVSKHLLETVKLDPAKQIILGYAESTGQQANGLVTEAQYKDPGFAGNRFITRLSGGMIPGARRGFDHVPVLADGGEFMMRSSVSSREGADRLQALNEGRASIALPGDGGSSRGGGDSQVMAMATNMLAAVATGLAQFSAVMERFGSMSPDDLLTMQADGNPATFGRATVRAMDEDYSIQDKFFRTTK